MRGLKRTPTAKLTESQWQTLRREFVSKGMVGGSDASTLLGLNPYKSAINLFYQALDADLLPTKINSQILHGKQLEEYVAKCWQYYDGTEDGWIQNTLQNNRIKLYKKVKAIIENPKYPMLFANIDGRITQHPDMGKIPGVLEIKTISGYASDMYQAGIPPSYLIQIQHYMLVTGYTWGEICYLKDGRDLGVITIQQDKELQDRILSAATEFQQRVQNALSLIQSSGAQSTDEKMQIASEFEPPADNTNAFNQFISEKHKAREDEVIMHGTDENYEWAKMYNELSGSIKELESQKQLYQNKLKQVMEKEGSTVMTLPNDSKITWRKQFLVRLN